MSWIQLIFTTQKDTALALSDALGNLGAASVTLQDAADQPLLEPGVDETPLWQDVIVTGLFNRERDTDAIIHALSATITPLPRWKQTQLDDKVWERECMQYFHAMKFGERTWVCPSWEPPPAPDAINIFLDPGLAFGTGTHATTALCLQWLDEHIKPGETVIDFGCGSGILGICALKHGASTVWAIDNDPQAIIATTENAKKNNVSEKLEILQITQKPDQLVDIILANILAAPLIELAALFANRVKPGGFTVLSGILDHQALTVTTAYQPWFTLKSEAHNDNWVRLVFERKLTSQHPNNKNS
ncbi:MAG: 50S ribosomal protein L11 methyltransferase [Gammaproteobacteria bacterium]|nr:50S ribosomal protein L11 methyltransferase [Gammaproteobacteria bacterium]